MDAGAPPWADAHIRIDIGGEGWADGWEKGRE